MDMPDRPRPWDVSGVALAQRILAEDGHAVVAFKEPASVRTLQTGVREAVSAATINAGISLLRAHGAQILHLYDAIGAVYVRMGPTVAEMLRVNQLIDYIEPRQHGELAVAGRVPRASVAQGTQPVTWGVSMVRAPEAWSITQGAGVTIQLVDTGHDRGHEDLPLVPTLNCSGQFGGCDDAFPVPHGSHVLGIWTARDNTIGVVGVAPGVSDADIFVYGACSSTTQECPTPEVTAGINSAIFNAKVINLSLEQPFDAAQSNAVAQAWSNDIVIVAAAGNNEGNTVIFPADYTNVVGVSGVRTDKSFASTSPCPLPFGGFASSNFGSHVDLAAAFWALSTVPGGYQDESDDWCGTSMATPHVAGVAVLLRSQNPTWTNQQVVDRLLATAEDQGDIGRDDLFGFGIVNAAAALGVVPPPLPVSIVGPDQVPPETICTWQAFADAQSPLHYEWWGVLSGSFDDRNWISGLVQSSGWLNVTITSADGRQGSDTFFVEVTSEVSECLER
jgi:subtilisin family serine protease